jgi:hypothetical protein
MSLYHDIKFGEMKYANRKKILLAHYTVADSIGAYPAPHHFYRYACGKN